MQIVMRNLSQLREDQMEMLRAQTQISTGRKIEIGSDNPSSTLRAVTLQDLLERKGQAQRNHQANQSFLSATEASLAQVSNVLNEARGTFLSAVSETGAVGRSADLVVLRQALQQLMDSANQEFQGRYLFSGSATNTVPYEARDDFFVYQGNEETLLSYSDIDLLSETNVTGGAVFGAISEPVRGTVDLNPILTPDRLIRDIRGGEGIRDGSFIISDGINSSVVDISKAETIADIAELIEANPPANRSLRVTISATGLGIEMDSTGGGELIVSELAGGTTGAELGILQSPGTKSFSLTGDDLNPSLKPTTSVSNILGVRAKAFVRMAGTSNDIEVEAKVRGPELNDVAIQFVDGDLLQAAPDTTGVSATFSTTAVAAKTSLSFTGVNNDLILTANTPGADFNNVRIDVLDDVLAGNSPVVNYDATSKILTIRVEDDGSTTANDIISAVAAETSGAFTATLDASIDTANTGLGPVGSISATAYANTANTGGNANTLSVKVLGDTTANDLVEAINNEGTFSAKLDPHDEVSSQNPGEGLVEIQATATTSGGLGAEFDKGSGIQIVNGEKTYVVSFESVETVEDILNLLNGSPAGVLAEINSQGNGIDVRSRISGTDFTIGENGGTTATQLGLRTFNLNTRLEDLNLGLGVHQGEGADFIIRRRDDVELEIDLEGLETVGQVISAINDHPNNTTGEPVVASLATFGNGLQLTNDDPFAIGKLQIIQTINGDKIQAAKDLGLTTGTISVDGEYVGDPASPALVASLDVPSAGPNNDLIIQSARPGAIYNDLQVEYVNTGAVVGDAAVITYDPLNQRLAIDIDPTSTTANTIIQALDDHDVFTATLNTVNDSGNDGSGIVTNIGVQGVLAGGAAETIQGFDPNPVETKSVFNTLKRLIDALEQNDQEQFTRLGGLLDEDIDRLIFSRAELGARAKGLDDLGGRLEDENIELQTNLSNEIDVDMLEAISNFTARQASLEASLRTIAQITDLTLLDFL